MNTDVRLMRLLAAGLAVCTVVVSPQVRAKDSFDVRFDSRGLSSVTHNGTRVVNASIATPGLAEISLVDSMGTVRRIVGPRPHARRFDARNRILVSYFAWGSLQTVYTVSPSRIDLTTRIVNTTNDRLADIRLVPLRLILPRIRENLDARVGSSGALLTHDSGTITVVDWQLAEDLSVRIRQDRVQGRAAASALELRTMREMRPHHPVVASRFFATAGRYIAPRASDKYRLTLLFGRSGAQSADLPPDYLRHVRRKLPMQISWSDRRPIAQAFLASHGVNSPTNPRGYIVGKRDKEDVVSEHGLLAFGAALMRYADRSISIMRRMDAQGVIVWDLEGQEIGHPITYLGDPRMLAEAAPEMNRFADAFMKKFTDAGFRVGITIRPTELFNPNLPDKPRWWHRDVENPIALMSDKIMYAKRRWNVSLVYLDSNVFGSIFGPKVEDKQVPWIMPADMVGRLQELHPDVLIIAEWSKAAYYRYAAPYSSNILRQFGTEPSIRLVYPNAFRAIVPDLPLLETHWDRYVSAVAAGDVLMYLTWWPAPENPLVRLVYEEARLHKTAVPQHPFQADAETLVTAARSETLATRYYAAALLADAAPDLSRLELSRLLDDPSSLVRKQALVSLRRVRVVDGAVLERLAAWVSKPQTADEAALRIFAAEALGSAGETALPRLLAMLQSQDSALWRYAIRGIAVTATARADIHTAVLRFVDRRYHIGTREAAVRALGDLKASSAVAALLDLLNENARQTEFLRESVIVALGKISDRRAVGPLVAHFGRAYSTVVMHTISQTLDEALRGITGQQGLVGEADWNDWWKNQTRNSASGATHKTGEHEGSNI